MKEQTLERKLTTVIQAIGGLCWKFSSPGTAGVPDRICIRHGRIIFIELKAPGPSKPAALSNSNTMVSTFVLSTTPTRSRSSPMHYVPHSYQTQATQFIEDKPEAAILLGMGLGKTVITLTAIWNLLLDSFQARRVLIIAPLRSPETPGQRKPSNGTTFTGSPQQ